MALGHTSTRGVMTVKQGFWSRLRRDHGASAVEYALLIAGIAIVMIVAVFFVGSVVVHFRKMKDFVFSCLKHRGR